VTPEANARLADHRAAVTAAAPASPRRNHVGTVSLLAAVGGAAACQVAASSSAFAGAEWFQLAKAGFEAATVGGLADWFAVTALFRHPLGLPIPHTAIIRERRAKIIEGIVVMVEEDWLSPEVIGARLERLSPSALLVDWLHDATHLERLGAPLRDLLAVLARMLTAAEVVDFLDRTLQRELRELRIDASLGAWLARLVASDRAAAAFETLARSVVNLAQQPQTAAALEAWLDRTARQLHQDGKRLVPLILRRKVVQRKVVEAACDYAAAELGGAAQDREHPLRRYVFGAAQRFAERLRSGDPEAVRQVEEIRAALADSLTARPLVLELLTGLRQRLERDLAAPDSDLSTLLDRQLRAGILDVLEQPQRRDTFDRWVRATADELLRRHHHQIGLTVREHLEQLDADVLVSQIEERVGADLQFIRLNGALVGGLIGVLLAVVHRLVG
jgi:uncharacterized membrane-anchored protein YjiN (DUF445 family)